MPPDLVPVDHDPFTPIQLVPVEHDPFNALAATAGIAPPGSPTIDQINWGQPSWIEQAAELQRQRAGQSFGQLRPTPAEIDFASGMVAPGTTKAVGAAEDIAKGIRAYHGSPYDFDRFDISKIGTGEGAQAYGHGLYFAENPKVAQEYREALGGATVGGMPYDVNNPRHLAVGLVDDLGSKEAALNNLHQRAARDPGDFFQQAIDYLQSDKALPEFKRSGKSYEVSINADPAHFLDWDKPLSEQHPKVQEALRVHGPQKGRYNPEPLFGEDYEGTGEHIYSDLMDQTGMTAAQVRAGQVEKAQALRDAGIPGIKYLDQGSRNLGPTADQARAGIERVQKTLEEVQNQRPQNAASVAYWTNELAAHQRDLENALKPQTHNYVVFDDKLIDIIKKYGLAGLIAGGAAHFSTKQVDHDPFQ